MSRHGLNQLGQRAVGGAGCSNRADTKLAGFMFDPGVMMAMRCGY